MPLYGVNVLVTIESNYLEIYLLRHLATPQIAARFEEDLNAVRVKFNTDAHQLYMNSQQKRDMEEAAT